MIGDKLGDYFSHPDEGCYGPDNSGGSGNEESLLDIF